MSEHALGALLAQENEQGKENALYYLSRRFINAEYNYSPIEKVCLALGSKTSPLLSGASNSAHIESGPSQVPHDKAHAIRTPR